ncbi:hypothetical protein Vadar_028978 [Vaccinium darrowii]|uniref:Uncharacterized protein n=1 Tax=Vaccinium darrowii TaxID=229202 RepID=A0ACB7YRJ7_9ERIC|nr:hypothetical protein Vadar_028978 [Vaccinium darrowii]
MFSEHEHEHQVDKSLISLVKSDKAGLYIRDFHGRWVLVDGDLGPHEVIVCSGLALYQATASYISPALMRTEIGNLHGNMFGRCSLAFKLMPKSMASLNCSEMRAAGLGVEPQFQLAVPVEDFMLRSHPTNQVVVVYASDATGKGISGSQSKTTLSYTPDTLRSYIESSAKSYASTKENVNRRAISEPVLQQVVTEQERAAKIHDFCFGVPFDQAQHMSCLLESLETRKIKQLRCKSQKNWDNRLFSKEDMEVLWPQKQDATVKRECMKRRGEMIEIWEVEDGATN